MSTLDIATQSEIATWQACRLKYHLSYEKLLKLKRINLSFHIGSVMHKWLELYYAGKSKGSLKAIHQEMAKASGEMGVSEEEEANETIACLEAVAQVYPTIDPIKRFKLKVVGIEKQFFIQDPNVPSRKLSGKIDIVALDAEGKIWIIDHKTVSRIDQRYVDSFRLNRQMQTYLMAARLDPYIKTLGRKIGGIIPNLIRKPRLVQKEGQSDEAFQQRVKKDIIDRQSEYFYSDMITYEEEANRNFEAMTWKILKAMRIPATWYAQHGLDKYERNLDSCETVYGRCPFHATCRNQPGHESMLTKKSARHEELTTDNKSIPHNAATKLTSTEALQHTGQPETAEVFEDGDQTVNAQRPTKSVGSLAALVKNLRGKNKKGK